MRLLECPELAAGCEETRAAVEEATEVLEGTGADELRQVRDAVQYIGEEVESIRTVLDRLWREMGELKKAVMAMGRDERQKRLF